MAREITESHQADTHTAGPTAAHGDLATPGAPLRHYMGGQGRASEENLAKKVCHGIIQLFTSGSRPRMT